VNLCKTNPGKGKQKVNQILTWEIAPVKAQKLGDRIRKKENYQGNSMITVCQDAGKKRVTVTVARDLEEKPD